MSCPFLNFREHGFPLLGDVSVLYFSHLLLMAFSVFHGSSNILEIPLRSSPSQYLLTSKIPYRLYKLFADSQMKPPETGALNLGLIIINLIHDNSHFTFKHELESDSFLTRSHPQL